MTIAGLEKKIKQLASPEKLLRGAREAMAREAESLAKRGFATSTAPSGARWQSLKNRNGKPLLNSGTLSKFSYKVTPNGFILYAGAGYFVHHQHGTTKIPARPMVPSESSWGSWARPMRSAAESAIARWRK